MPKEEERKSDKPKSAGRVSASRGRYWARSTCFSCPGQAGKNVQFTSPKKRARHIAAGHQMKDKLGPIATMLASVDKKGSFLETPIVFKEEKTKGKSRKA